jgi:hypothetical protein
MSKLVWLLSVILIVFGCAGGGIFVGAAEGGKNFLNVMSSVPQQIVVPEDQAYGLERALHNFDQAAVSARGHCDCIHTLVASSVDECILLEFNSTQQIAILRQAHDQQIAERVRFLQQVTSLNQSSASSRLKMAAAMSRLVRAAINCIVQRY